MIRSLLVALLFFFGPAILVFMLRSLFLALRFWWRVRQARQAQQTHIIDITPRDESGPSKRFIAAAIAIGLLCAWLAWQEMQEGPGGSRAYIPAHVNEQGELVPGRTVPAEPAERR